MSTRSRKAPPVTIAGHVARGARDIAAGAALALALSSVAAAQTPSPGTLDSGFGEGGRVLTPIGSWIDRALGVAVDGQGRLVVAGYADMNDSRLDFVVVRYLPDGALDPDFGSGGIVVTPMGQGAAYDVGEALLIQPDGRIVVAGDTTEAITHRVAIVRYNPDGTLDSSFGGTGKVLTDLGRDVQVRAVLRQPDGKILVAGSIATAGTGWDLCVVRYYANGARDLTFGAGGVFAPAISGHQEAVGIAWTPAGRIVVAAAQPLGSAFLLARLYAHGELDWTFGSYGLVTTPLSSGALAEAMAVHSNGKIVIAGDAPGGYAVLARYLPGGALDTAFDGDGTLTLQLSPDNVYVDDVVVQRNGKIVVAGSADRAGALIRFDTDGTPDTGLVLTPLGAEVGGFNSVALQADGKIVAAGAANIYYDNYEFALARYWGDVVDLIFADGFDGP
jgi:uncharacterized delta-60 repeat protein